MAQWMNLNPNNRSVVICSHVTATRVYFPDEPQVQVHQQWITRCPLKLVTGYYWYGSNKHSTGGTHKWEEDFFQKEQEHNVETDHDSNVNTDIEQDDKECNDDKGLIVKKFVSIEVIKITTVLLYASVHSTVLTLQGRR